MEKIIRNPIYGAQMALNSNQKQTLATQLQDEIKCIDSCFKQELNKWNRSIRLLILAEAPLSCDKYFYNKKRGNFLRSLKECFGVDQDTLLDRLRMEGILVLDMYELPIQTRHYDADARDHFLFDIDYFCRQLNLLDSRRLLDKNTFIIFRYQKIIDRFLDMKAKGLFNACLLAEKYLLDPNFQPVRLNKKERGKQVLSDQVKAVLNCK